jgi:hypothetical protein
MDARRIRLLAAPALAVALLVTLWVAPAAAAECVLSAPELGKVDTPLPISGTGFPASSSVDIKLTVEGGKTDQFAVQSDPSGGFQFSLTPGASDAGTTTIDASAGSTCSARAVSMVLGPSATPPAAHTGAAAGVSGGPSAPRTDVAAAGDGAGGVPTNAWLVGLLVVLIGIIGLMATRPARSR